MTSEFYSRVSSLQSFPTAGTRSTTPKEPPGFENTHAHPIPTSDDVTSGQRSPARTPAVPVLPAVPTLPQHATTTKPNQLLTRSDNKFIEVVSETNDDTLLENHETDITSSKLKDSAGKPMVPANDQQTKELVLKDKAQDQPQAAPAAFKETSRMGPSTKADQASANTVTSNFVGEDQGAPSNKPGTTILDSATVTSPDAILSRPVTPGTAVAETTKSSTARPRTLRLTTSMIQQAEATRMPSPATTEKSVVLPALSQARREHSRQPSLSSLSRSRPSSPGASDRLISQDVSRAGSPPLGGIVGSAPGRTKTKAQAKKERKEKAKKVEADDASIISNSNTPNVEEVGPIIARQKKQKKTKAPTVVTEDLPRPNGNKAEKKQTSKTTEAEVEKVEEIFSPSKDESKREESEQQQIQSPIGTVKRSTSGLPVIPYTVRDLHRDSLRHPNSPTAIQSLLSSQVSPMSKIINEMVTAGDLSRDHPWLTNPSFNSSTYKVPSDSRRGQDYLNANGYSGNNAFGYLYIDLKDKKELRNGAFVKDSGPEDQSEDLLNSFLLTPRGWVLRHLTNEESERVQELEYKRVTYEKQMGEFGSMADLGVLEHDDYANLGGGLNELLHSGDRHGVHWVMEEEDMDQSSGGGGGGGGGNGKDTLSYDHLDDRGPLAESVGDDPDDETDEDVGLDFMGNAPGASGIWRNRFEMEGSQQGLTDMAASNLVSNSGRRPANTNLRAMDSDALHKRIHEKHREVDSTKKEMEKIEKLLTRKNKEFARWRDALLKA